MNEFDVFYDEICEEGESFLEDLDKGDLADIVRYSCAVLGEARIKKPKTFMELLRET